MTKIDQLKLFRSENGREELLKDSDWGIIYVLRTQYDDLYKIGFTNREIEERLKDMDGMNPHKLLQIKDAFVKHPIAVEKYLHTRFKEFRAKKEWFKFRKKQVDEVKRIIQFFAWMDNSPTSSNED